MSSYERFLGASNVEVLPYFGGSCVDSRTRRLRVVTTETPMAPGWWRFSVAGRMATPVAPADPDLTELPVVRGHAVGDLVVVPPSLPARVHFAPFELPRFAPVVARRWVGGELLFEVLDFETGAEAPARDAFDRGVGLASVREVPATLRGAFALALLLNAAVKRGVHVSPAEVRGDILAVAEEGEAAADGVIDRLERERAAHRAGASAVIDRLPVDAAATPWQRPVRTTNRGDERVHAALDNTRATLLDSRLLGQGLLEVRFRFMDEVFVSVVDRHTLQVYDAGICLAGHDEELTLESLPSVIREAIRTGRLVLTNGWD